ncbi:MAG TPA: response regulator [Puia sp.]|jgi:two-component system response regulator|nr:response regulator [Puia sp.]
MNPNAVDILLVEDNPDDAELTIRELRRHHISNKLVHVRDGEEALHFLFGTGKYANEQVNYKVPKIILLDIQMPGISGMEVLKSIKSDDRTSAIPVIILTSSNQHPNIQVCYDLGANSYIVKPLNFERFSQSIRNLGYHWLLLNQAPV